MTLELWEDTDMSDQEILTKAIEKAEKNGFNFGPSENGRSPKEVFTRNIMQDLFFRRTLIFNHDFAKTLWHGTIHPNKSPTKNNPVELWQYHLQQMVIADDPIKYLGENI